MMQAGIRYKHTLAGGKPAAGMLCSLWNALLSVECFAACGMLCFLRNALLSVECLAACGMLCFLWNAFDSCGV